MLALEFIMAPRAYWKGYLKLIEQRPSAHKVTADRKAEQAASVAERAAASASAPN